MVVIVVVLGGCAGFQGQETPPPGADPPESRSPPRPWAPGPTYEPTPHTGRQPGEIRKDGTCEVAVSGQNAAIFSAENLSAITTTRATVDATRGYLARPAAEGTYPAVVMIHEWWGLNENIEHMADVLAGHGYVVFAVDLYDGEVATDSSRAAELSGRVRGDPDAAVATMARAVPRLRTLEYTTDEVASLGWCFGGGQSLQLSLSEAELNATVIYYGTLATDAETLRHVDEPVLGIFGAEDEVVGIENVRAFERTLGELGIEHEVYVYEGADHAFANPSGQRYQPEATRGRRRFASSTITSGSDPLLDGVDRAAHQRGDPTAVDGHTSPGDPGRREPIERV